jgi:hypothetical protein
MTSSAGNDRSVRIPSISRPTLPVAPTTATLKPMMTLQKSRPLRMHTQEAVAG